MWTCEPHRMEFQESVPNGTVFCATRARCPCRSRVVARSEGGLQQDSAMVCNTTIYPYLIAGHLCLSAIARPASARYSGKGQDGSDPPFFAAVSARGGGGLQQGLQHHPPPFSEGRSRPIYPCGKAPNPNPKRALTRRRQAP